MNRTTVSLLALAAGLVTFPAHAANMVIAAPQLTLTCLGFQPNADGSVDLTCKLQSTGATSGQETPTITGNTLEVTINGSTALYPLSDLSSGEITQTSLHFLPGTYQPSSSTYGGVTFGAYGTAQDVIFGNIWAYPGPPAKGQFFYSNSLQVTDANQPPAPLALGSCTYEGTLSTTPLNFSAGGGDAYVVVATQTAAQGAPAGCPWSLATMDGAANIAQIDNHGAIVLGPGQASFTMLPNTIPNGNTNSRTYAVDVHPATPAGALPAYDGRFSFTQDGLTCGYTASGFNPPQAGYSSSSPGAVTITTTSPLCQWSVTSASAAMTVVEGIGHLFTGSGVFHYYVGANTSGPSRTLQFALGTALTDTASQPGIQTTITLQTNPPSQQLIVDGTTYTAPQTFQWTEGSSHTLNVPSPQLQPGGGSQLVFSSWSQGGSESQTITAPSPSTSYTYTASFTTQYRLGITVSPANSGTVTPASGGFYNAGTNVSLTPTASAGYAFSGWQGPVLFLPGTTSAFVTMSSQENVTALFVPAAPIPITVQATPGQVTFTVDGASYTGLQSFEWQPGSTHQISTTTPQHFLGGSYYLSSGSANMTVAPTSATTYSFTFTRSGLIGFPGSGTDSTASALRIHAGGEVYTDPSGNTWVSDTGFSGGVAATVNTAIANTSSPELYQSERASTDPFQYDLPVADGNYLVTLKFAELHYQSPGNRLFNVAVNGQAALTNFDPANVAGGSFRAVDQKIPVTVSNGRITISFEPILDAATVSAIEVASVPASIRTYTGASDFTTPDGVTWTANPQQCGGAILTAATTIAGTRTPDLYQTACSAASGFEYDFAVPGGDYRARLKFAEIVYDGPGHRQFDVSINGNSVLTHFDPALAAGGAFTAVDRQFLASAEDAGLAVRFDPWMDTPIVSGFEIVPVSVVRMNPGGSRTVDSMGHEWSGDYNYSGGNPLTASGRTGRGGTQAVEYHFAVLNGQYEVQLDCSGGGTVSVGGRNVPAHSGKTTVPVTVTDGKIIIQLMPAGPVASIHAIQILPAQ